MKNQLLNQPILIIFLLLTHSLFSQEITIGPVQNIAYGFDGVYPVSDKSFFVGHYDKFSGTSLVLSHYTDLKEDATSGTIATRDRGVFVIDGKLFVFEQSKKKGSVILIAQQYGNDCMPAGELKEVFSYELTSTTLPKEDVDAHVVQSSNKEYFAVYYEIEHHKKMKYAFRIYDKSFALIREGQFDSPFDELDHAVRDQILTDQGDLYFLINEIEYYVNSEDKILGFYVWKLENNALNEIKIDIEGKRLEDVKVMQDSGKLSCFGLSRISENDSIESFFGNLNFTNRTFSLVASHGLSTDFIQFTGSEFSYRIADVIKRDNGENGFVVEQYKHIEGMKSDNGTPVHYSYTSYYDIKVLMFDSNNDLVWTQRLGHRNQSGFSGDYYKTFHGHSTNEKYIVYLNGNKERDGTEAPQMFTVTSDKIAAANNCFSRITVNLNTGESKKELLTELIESDWYLDIEGCVWDEYNQRLLVTFYHGLIKYRFGALRL